MLGPDAWYGYAVIVIGCIAFPFSRCWVILFFWAGVLFFALARCKNKKRETGVLGRIAGSFFFLSFFPLKLVMAFLLGLLSLF